MCKLMDRYNAFIGKVLDGRYKILEVLGVGGMAFVLKAVDLVMNRIVAIKILNDQYNGDEQAEERFINESKAVAMLSHKNIVSVYDVAIYPDMKYIVMEYLDGITLKEYLNNKGALPWKEACIYVGQILHALEHAHGKGVIHRDIKPQNIILQKNGEIKVTDFGIAKLPTDSTLTVTEKAIGTVYYISPEQASGKETGFYSDIYSTGVVLYEALTGKLPFVADTPVSIALMQINDEPVPPEQIKEDIPLGVSQIVMKAMQKDPAARFATAHGMVKAIDCVLRDPQVVFTDNAVAAENSTDKRLININNIETGEIEELQSETEPAGPAGKKEKTKKKKKIKEERRSRSLFPIITGVFIAFFVVALAGAGYLAVKWIPSLFETPADNSFNVRNLVGKTYDAELETLLISEKYEITVKYGYNANLANGTIIAQDPSSGPKNIPGEYCKITLTVNSLYDEIKVPDVKYLKSLEARTTLESYGFKVNIEQINDSFIQPDQVVRTSPASGEVARTGDTITIYVSNGPGKLSAGKMINVVGMNIEEAASKLTSLFYKVEITEQESQEPDGTVLEQSIPAGSDNDAWTVVTLTVSKFVEKETVTVPDLFGLTLDEALKTLTEAGLVAGDVDYQPATYPPNTVIDQSLEKDTEVEPGSEIDLVLCEPDEPDTSAPSDESSLPDVTPSGGRDQ